MRQVARPAPKPRKYEMMIVVAPTVSEDGLPAVVERVTGMIETLEGTVESFTHDNPWGHRRLAYPIQNFRDAFYVLYYFHMAPRGIQELDRELRLDDAIIRHLIIKYDPLMVRDFDDDEPEDGGDASASAEDGAEATATAEAAPAGEAEESGAESEDAGADDAAESEAPAEEADESEADGDADTEDGEEDEE